MGREITARRHWYYTECTQGVLIDETIGTDPRLLCYILEDTVRPYTEPKVPGATAIPTGRFQLTVDYSQRFRKYMFHIESVPGFSGIRIHGGNRAVDTEGCLLTGDALGDRDVLYSQAALAKLYTELTVPDGWDESYNCAKVRMKEPTWITVENGTHLEGHTEIDPKEVVNLGQEKK